MCALSKWQDGPYRARDLFAPLRFLCAHCLGNLVCASERACGGVRRRAWRRGMKASDRRRGKGGGQGKGLWEGGWWYWASAQS